jgi:4-amino-4-deoxy-L-arabinose transferase-like glycosyltransferase
MHIFRNKEYLNDTKKNEVFIVFSFCIIGIILRTLLFSKIPPGLNQDEAAAGYEAYSLLLTGKDKWGNIWPGYFIAWGAGQNVLYSYLLLPVIHFFGLNTLSVRSINLIFGILSIPLLYQFTKNTISQKIAYIATFLIAINPWHIMLSRWALESNLLPFFTLLGFYTIDKALDSNTSSRQRIFCLVPWAIALYAYGIFYLTLPVLFFLIFKTYKEKILECRNQWIAAILIFSILISPIILFTLKNVIFRRGLFFEKYLPFSVPLLTSTPLRNINPISNLEFLLNGFQDNNIWNHIPGVPSFYMIAFPFLCIGLYLIRNQKNGSKHSKLFVSWLFSCLPLLFISSLNINRANSVFLPAMVISVIGFEAILKQFKDIHYKKLFKTIIINWVLISSLLFTINYFSLYSEKAYDAFNYGLESALYTAKTKSLSSEKILITNEIKLPYVYVLFFNRYLPDDFQNFNQHSLDKDGIYKVKSFGRYYFNSDDLDLKSQESFVFLQKTTEIPVCNNPFFLEQTKYWNIGRCFSKSI